MKKACLVLGLGDSTAQAKGLDRFFTIGVNDIARYHQPDILLILDRPGRFTRERLEFISMTQSHCAYVCHPELWGRYLPDVGFVRKLNTVRLRPETDPMLGVVYHHITSPFAAASFAQSMQHRPIGVLGVDLVNHHLASRAEAIDRAFWQLHLAGMGPIYNCSPISKLTLPYRDLEDLKSDKRHI